MVSQSSPSSEAPKDLAQEILSRLADGGCGSSVCSLQLSSELGVPHQAVVGGVKSLECLDQVISAELQQQENLQLTPEGQQVAANGSHEACVWQAVGENGLPQPELVKKLGPEVAKVGLGKALAKGWVLVDKKGASGKGPLVLRKAKSIVDSVSEHLQQKQLSGLPTSARAEYKKRKLLTEVVVKSYLISRGPNFSTTATQSKAVADLTSDMIASGAWKNATFKSLNMDAMGVPPPSGYMHPLLKVRTEFCQIFLEMGFSEMPTNNFVESSFWNFDALFQPQQHPARDAHDTFFVSEPKDATSFPDEYLEKVKKVHSIGGYGSQGYGYDWKMDEAKKNLLRTHTTAVSARMLHQLAADNMQNMAEGKPFKPARYFSIDRVFRNETLDATHLAEFHQIEGVIADVGLTLGDLIGVLYAFFRKLGIEKLRFKPAYNPYTEPSMEIFSYHEGLKKWVEVGNSGVFRPEMLLPMGLPENVNVIAWGLSLERPTMIKYGFNNIRELCGNKMSLKLVQDNPICRLEKSLDPPSETLQQFTEKRLASLESKLAVIKARVSDLKEHFKMEEKTLKAAPSQSPPAAKPNAKEGFKNRSPTFPKDVVIRANPAHSPPYFLKALVGLLAEAFGGAIIAKTYEHCDMPGGRLDQKLKDYLSHNEDRPRSDAKLVLALIWCRTKDVSLIPKAGVEIIGKEDILRYFGRLCPPNQTLLPYDQGAKGIGLTTATDAALDCVAACPSGDAKSLEKALEPLKKTKGLTLAHIAAWDKAKAGGLKAKELSNVTKTWMKTLEAKIVR